MENNIPSLFGSMVFNDEVMCERLPNDVYRSLTTTIAKGKTIDPSIANTIASAMKEWAIEKGATHYSHWFQPLTGMTAEKHDAFISPIGNGRVIMEFSGKELIKGESDASSFPTGGVRATFEARGYTAWDPASYAFVKDGTLFIPTAFCSYTGEALDAKTPLLRSLDALNTQTLRILRLFGDNSVSRVIATVGAEQEYFLIDRELYEKRKDLKYTGHTLFGASAPKGQELEDHYFGELRPRVSAYMQDLDKELWKLGINAKTKHNEAAPAQHELAPIYDTVNLAVDQNLLTMELMKKVADRHDLVCLLHEKPFAGVNGSGKHNNWSLTTDMGKNLLDPGRTPAENAQFLLILAAVIKAVDEYQDLLRLSVAYLGNDARLGGNEAPPVIISMFIGDELEGIINAIAEGNDYHGVDKQYMDFGIPSIPKFSKDTSDRNRTSPFAFTGNKFEFRMPGSSQSISMPNIVLNTIVAHEFRQFADILEKAEDFDSAVAELVKKTFVEHRRILFNGNGYSEEWRVEAQKRGLLELRNAVDSYPCLTDEKNVELFSSLGVMNFTELKMREDVYFENYAKIMNIEALTMIEMASRDIIPSVNKYVAEVADIAITKRTLGKHIDCSVEEDIVDKLSTLNAKAYDELQELIKNDTKSVKIEDNREKAEFCRDCVLPTMRALRSSVDAMEVITSSEYWPLPTSGDLMFSV